jgi:hypothetical protein
MALASSVKDQRAFGRRRTLVHAFAHIPGRPLEPCVVHNISDAGALVEFRARVHPPEEFRLVIDTLRIDHKCRVRHVTANKVGVEFLGVRADVSHAAGATPSNAAAGQILSLTTSDGGSQDFAEKGTARDDAIKLVAVTTGREQRLAVFGRPA